MYDVVKDFCRTKSTVTVVDLNNLLDELASTGDQTDVFRKLFGASNAEEIKWATRIILKDLKLGIKVENVLNNYHPDGNDFYNLTNSLLEMCRKFENPKTSLNDDIEIFHPIRPMLAGKKKIDFFKYQNRQWYVETKYDG
jgi:DNA ligase-4